MKKPTCDELRNRIAVSLPEAATLLGIARATGYRRLMSEIRCGKIKSVKIGKCRRILVSSLIAWVENEAA